MMRSPKRNSGSPKRGYVVLGLGLLICTALFLFWPTGGQGASWQQMRGAGGPETDLTKDRVIEALLAENERLQKDVDTSRALASAGGAGGACNCDAEVDVLKAKLRRVQDELANEKDARRRAEQSCSSPTKSSAVVASPSNVQAVPSCAHQKLEFLRWREDSEGNKLWCPFTAENYDNWTKMPPFCDYISIECLGERNLRAAHIYGFGGPTLMIGYADVMIWEFVWARHTRQKNMVELGTMSGGTSLYWGMAARVRGGEFHTYDLNDNRHSMPKRGWLPNMHFHQTDILSNVNCDDPSTHVRDVVDVIDTGEAQIALFDNGNKKKETDCYARYLAVGSVLLLHDWEHLDLPKPHWEMTYSYVQKELEFRGFKKAYFDFAEHLGSSTRVFIRVSEGPL